MSDLTDEEIIATRRLHGLDDGLYKETKMKDIEVGDYIRTKAGIVGKVIKVLSNRVFLDNLGYAVLIKDIVKHDKNLIYLIEVNDVVNGYRILEIYEKTAEDEERILDIGYGMSIFNEEVKTILTHELYEANCYKVGGEDE